MVKTQMIQKYNFNNSICIFFSKFLVRSKSKKDPTLYLSLPFVSLVEF